NMDHFLLEAAEGKNLHLTHLQDKVVLGGMEGTKEAIEFLTSLTDMLSVGTSKIPIDVTVKWDGAPAIFAGINPDNKKFFVGTKGIFAQNAKLNYTPSDIDRNYPGSPGLANKLKIALQYLPELGIKGILQGDMMFTHDDLKTSKIDGNDYVTFQPNTIVYAVPKGTTLEHQISTSRMGVVWHTSYNGATLADSKAKFGVDIGALNHTKDVWFRDASYTDVSGAATLTDAERKNIDDLIDKAKGIWKEISPSFLNQVAGNSVYSTEILTWNNSKVREGSAISDTIAHARDFLINLNHKLNQAIIEAKKEDTKLKREKEKNIIMNFFQKNINNLKNMFDLQNLFDKAKNMIVKKLQQIRDIGHFLKTD